MTRLFQVAVLFCCVVASTLGGSAADTSYVDYLAKNGLKAEECASHSPSKLFRVVLEREDLGYEGTPGHEATVVDTFYQKYLETLKPYNDTHNPDAAKARQALRELFYNVTDAFEDATHDRTYITHERIDAFVEHLITCLAASGAPGKAYDLDFSVDDATAYLRARLVIAYNEAVTRPDFDTFRAQVASKLRQIYKKYPVEAITLHYYLAIFADNYLTPLNPLIGTPE